MVQRDYLIRQASRFAEVLARIVGLIKRQQYQPALAVINRECMHLLGLPSALVSGSAGDELFAMLTSGETVAAGVEKCLIITALLRCAGKIHAAQKRSNESYSCHLTALDLLLEVLLHHDGLELPVYAPGDNELASELEAYLLPFETNVNLLRHYEQTGAYAKAEDTLFRMIESEPGNTKALEVGMAFYERLRQQEDEALIAGNLPRDEVEAGQRGLQEALIHSTHSSRCSKEKMGGENDGGT